MSPYNEGYHPTGIKDRRAAFLRATRVSSGVSGQMEVLMFAGSRRSKTLER